jgi:hypothetical protein
METATGPLLADTAYTAAIERLDDADAQIPGDEDWYVFYTASAVRLDVAYTNLQASGSCFGPLARLLDGAGNPLGSAHPARNRTEHMVFDAPGPGTYFLRVTPYPIETCAPPDSLYRFEIGPLGSLMTPPGQTAVQPVPVPPPRRNPGPTITSARLRNGRLTVTGRLARGASARRIRITAWRRLGRRLITFGTAGRPAGIGRWTASRLLPRSLRRVTWLRFRVSYLPDRRFIRRVLPSRIVRVSRR